MLEAVRIATPSDAADIATLVNAAYRPDEGKEGWTHESALVDGARTNTEQVAALLARSDGVMLLGRRDDVTVACVHLSHGSDAVTIGMLAVNPPLQNAGLGKAMLAHAETCAVHLFNPQRLLMHVVEARRELIAFYVRRGYAPSGEISAYPRNSGVGQPKFELRIIELHKQPDIKPVEG